MSPAKPLLLSSPGPCCGWLLLTLLAAPACRDRDPAATSGSRTGAGALDLTRLGADRRTTLRALRMPPHQVALRLGAHQLTCTTQLSTQVPGLPARLLKQEISVRSDGKGQYAAVKNTHPQYGHEVIHLDGWLYPRLRWNKFQKRRPEPEEPVRLLDRMAGLLPAYERLLRRFLALESKGQATVEGRPAVKVKLKLAGSPPPPRAESGPARQWRRTLLVSALDGEALLDARTGAPLRVELRASWSFNPPAPGAMPPSGIPARSDPKVVARSELRFSLKVSAIGKPVALQPPPEAETLSSPRLTRIEIERKMLTGELPLEESWGPP